MKLMKSSLSAKTFTNYALLISLVLCSILLLVPINPSYAQGGKNDNDPHATGLLLPTPEEEEAFMKTHAKVEMVLPNEIALERVNEARKKKDLHPLSKVGTVPIGKEIMTTKAPIALETEIIANELLNSSLYVDNSLEIEFPPIRTQGGLGSCVSFAVTYYQLTYMAGFMYNHDSNPLTNWNNQNEDNTTKFSPKWTYNFVNFVNGGENNGSYVADNYDVLEKHGAATWAEFPYDGVDYKTWCTNPAVWQNAITYRINPAQYIMTNDIENALNYIKTALANGYVLTFPTFISSWQYTTIKDDKSTSDDNPFVGKPVCYWVNGEAGAHLMTFVGYNDNVWIDINKNKKVDPGEKGALRVANSWGDAWQDNGFIWLAYDALRSTSLVPNGPVSGRVPAIRGAVFAITVKDNYSPKMLAEFTVSHARRNQLRMNLGISDVGLSIPSLTWHSGSIDLQGGPYAFDGTITESEGTFVFDYTDILPPNPEGSAYKYYLGIFDSMNGSPASFGSFKLKVRNASNGYDIVNSIYYELPKKVDGIQYDESLECSINNGASNNPPSAKASVDITTGPVPLTVSFTESGSSDPDGNAITYFWNFGDGPGIPGSPGGSVTHIYNYPGIYSAKLTVTDNLGASSSVGFCITITTDPAITMYVSNIAMSISKVSSKVNANATVNIKNLNGIAIQGARVSGHWSGATNDSDSGLTDTNGNVTLESNTLRPSAGTSLTFTFTVDSVTKSGYIYDSNRNVMTSNSISYNAAPPLEKEYATNLDIPYPIPSNPEVWIPFTLSNQAQVIIKIYNANGDLVQTLDLGQRSPGVYLTKEKSAYWDGRNSKGEQVSSGIYFVSMETVDFTATRKIVMVR